MNAPRLAVAALTALALLAEVPALAQTTTSTSTSRDTSVSGKGVVTHKTKVVRVHKHVTRRSKRVLGVKVGHKTRVTKTVTTTKRSSNGDTSTTVKTSH